MVREIGKERRRSGEERERERGSKEGRVERDVNLVWVSMDGLVITIVTTQPQVQVTLNS